MSLRPGFWPKRGVHRGRSRRRGNPIGTVIDEPAAIELEERVNKAVAAGAEVLLGGNRNGAQLEPTIIANVPRDAEMVCEESFGPLAPIMPVRDLDDAIALANSSDFGLSSGVVTNDMAAAIRVVKELKTGAVNVNQVPGSGWNVRRSAA